MIKIESIMLGTILLSLIISVYFHPKMPERIASHWNILGQVDGYLPKFWGCF